MKYFLSFILATWSFLGLSQSCFSNSVAVSYNVFSSPNDICKADFNNDGKIDFATSDGSSRISILINNGNRLFQAFSTNTVTNNADLIYSVDINNDGNFDIASFNSASNSVAFLIGNGAGTFSATPKILIGSGLREVNFNDFNNDGKTDIVAADTLISYYVLLNNGSGGFSSTTYSSGFTSKWTSSISSADYDKDGNIDFVMNELGMGKTWMFKGNGNGTFVKTIGYSTSASFFIESADLNNDTYPDMVYFSPYIVNPGIDVYLGTVSGTLSYSGSYSITTGSFGSFKISLEDVNNDGKKDMFATSTGTPSYTWVYIGNGTGTFSLSGKYFANDYSRVSTGADIDGDGKFDLAVTGGINYFSEVSVLYGISPGTFPVIQRNFAGNSTFISDLTSIDFDGDGKSDVLACTNNGVISYKSNGSQTLTPTNLWILCDCMSTGDFNSDGKMDVATAWQNGNLAVSIAFGDGFGNTVSNSTYTVIPNWWGLVKKNFLTSGDYNNDGKNDVAVIDGYGTMGIMLNTGPGIFSINTFTIPTANPNNYSVKTADFNNDGKLDLLVASDAGNDFFTVLIGNGNGTFNVGSNFITNTSIITNMIASDFNNDGKIDLAFSKNNCEFEILYGDGAGNLSSAGTFSASGYGMNTITSGDFNNDGKMDICLSNGGSQNFSLFYNTGISTFSVVNLYSSYGAYVVTGDVDANGGIDIITTDLYSSFAVSFNDCYSFAGVDEYSSKLKSDIKIYPNPTSGKLFLEFSKRFSFKVYDIYGRNVKELIEFLSSNEIDLHDLSEGIYVLMITDENNSNYFTMFIKE